MRLTKTKLMLTKREARIMLVRMNAVSQYVLNLKTDAITDKPKLFREDYKKALNASDALDAYTLPLMHVLREDNHECL